MIQSVSSLLQPTSSSLVVNNANLDALSITASSLTDHDMLFSGLDEINSSSSAMTVAGEENDRGSDVPDSSAVSDFGVSNTASSQSTSLESTLGFSRDSLSSSSNTIPISTVISMPGVDGGDGMNQLSLNEDGDGSVDDGEASFTSDDPSLISSGLKSDKGGNEEAEPAVDSVD
ncbi:hypothetical protein ACQZV8_21040 [Magnetococcales bacterium HHB-1]